MSASAISSSVALWKEGVNHTFVICVTDGSNDPVTGLVNANFTKRLVKTINGSVPVTPQNATNTVTVTEIDSVNAPGMYAVTYVPLELTSHTGLSITWACWVTHATHNKLGWLDQIETHARKIDDIPTSTQNANATMSEIAFVDGYAPAEALMLIGSAVCGKGQGTVDKPWRSLDDSQDRVTAVTTDEGERTAVTLNISG